MIFLLEHREETTRVSRNRFSLNFKIQKQVKFSPEIVVLKKVAPVLLGRPIYKVARSDFAKMPSERVDVICSQCSKIS